MGYPINERNNNNSYYLSAYAIAVKHGFVGTEEEWLESLNGMSAYDAAVKSGYTGTEEEFDQAMADIASAVTTTEGYATAAASSASDAEGYASNAASSATGAANSADDASDFASAASGYATNAQNSATAASGYKDTAKDYMDAAKVYRDEALGAEPAAEEYALVSEGYATGEQGGVPEGSGTYYHNNAKYYKEQAAESASEIENLTVTAVGLDAGESPTATKTGGSGVPYNIQFGIPKGDKGDKGDPGTGDMSSADYDSTSAVKNAGGIPAYVAGKADKVSGATADDLAKLDANGNLVDSGKKLSDLATTTDLAGKADKVSSATNGHLAGLDSNGNLTDSGIAAADVFLGKTAENDPDNSSFDVEFNGAAKSTLISALLKGKTAGINQLVPKKTINAQYAGVPVASSNDGKISLSGTSTGTTASDIIANGWSVIAGHTYFLRIGLNVKSGSASPSNSTYRFKLGDGFGSVYANDDAIRVCTTTKTGTEDLILFVFNSGVAIDVDIYPQVIDLSLIFTATELTAIGTDVSLLKSAWLKKFGYPLPQYIPYNAGSLVSNNAVYQLCGRNVWDEEWEVGGLVANCINSKNYIRVFPNETYFFKVPSAIVVYEYTADKSLIGTEEPPSANRVLTMPSNCAYIKFRMASNYGTTYNNDICISISDNTFNGNYEQWYNGGQIDLSANAQNGIGTVQDEIDVVKGAGTKRVKIADFSDITWYYSTGSHFFYTLPVADLLVSEKTVLAEGYRSNTTATYGEALSDMDITQISGVFYVKNSNYTNGAAFKTAMTGKKIAYALATPVSQTITPQSLVTKQGYNLLMPVSGDIQSGNVAIEFVAEAGQSIVDLISVIVANAIAEAE